MVTVTANDVSMAFAGLLAAVLNTIF